jgi:hypothetical protein
MKKKLQFHVVMPVLLLAAVIVSCEKNISIKPLSYLSKLSVQSLITPGDTPRVYLYRTVPYFDKNTSAADLFVRNATITMTGGNQAISFKTDSAYNVVRCEYEYFWKGNNEIVAGTNYTLTVNTTGKTLVATAVTNQRKVHIDSIGYTSKYKDIYGEHEGISIHFTDLPGKGEYYRYRMGRAIFDSVVHAETQVSPCSIGKQNYVVEIGRSVYSDKDQDGQDMTFFFEPTYSHKRGQTGFISLQTLDENAFFFFDNLDRQKLAQYNPFVEPVFIKAGQFGNDAIGFFSAYALSDSVRFVYPE